MKKVTILDIAKELDITFSTVARALNDHPAISKNTKEAVKATAERLGYRKNKIASSLRSGKSNIIGVLVPSLDVSFFSSVVHGIESVMNQNGYSILLYQSQESFKKEDKGIETLLNSRVDGIIASVAINREDTRTFEDIVARNIPLAFFDRSLDSIQAPSVTIDDYKGGYMATEHLIQAGYRQIAHITETRNLTIFKERLNGYLDALKDYNLPIREEMIFKGNLSLEFGKTCVKEMTQRKISFDAIFTLEDYTAMGVIQQLKEQQISVPDQVGVIGFANEAFGSLVTPTLSTIDQQTNRMGEEIAKLFINMLKQGDFYKNSPKKIKLEPLLIVRESSLKYVSSTLI
ncbi:LacI family DNA-binding transcriptional regulator [Olivibacter sp. SDN3]|uniref:LacI family DNA-binding transcriptional regulator n=1 Tax=Olivibacter sp. SDN3 TaxID=2764720 RepID=UPI0016512C43|nr:LacI family DNA-binding transcriptional regulator [Olivibacter sp. SDN3]QNL49484.1 LacI family DNA-binding transcriptional regulator [Olivibacter sp. SDN3]